MSAHRPIGSSSENPGGLRNDRLRWNCFYSDKEGRRRRPRRAARARGNHRSANTDHRLAEITKEVEAGAALSPEIFGSLAQFLQGPQAVNPLAEIATYASYGANVAAALAPILPVSALGSVALKLLR